MEYKELKKLIEIYGSQRKVATVLGVNQSQISRWLNKKTSPRVTVREKLIDLIQDKVVVPSHKRVAGKHTDGRPFVRYEFSLWRRILNDPTKIPELFKKLKRLYKKSESFLFLLKIV